MMRQVGVRPDPGLQASKTEEEEEKKGKQSTAQEQVEGNAQMEDLLDRTYVVSSQQARAPRTEEEMGLPGRSEAKKLLDMLPKRAQEQK